MSGFKKYLSNTSWLFAQKILSIVVSLFITVWMARYLGPEQFGILNYAISFVALFVVLSTLGLNTLATRELLNHPEDSEIIFVIALIISSTFFFNALNVIKYSKESVVKYMKVEIIL